MKKPLKIALYVLTGLSVLGLIARIDYKTKPATSDFQDQQEKVIIQTETAKPNARRDLVLNQYSWQKGGDGSVGFHSFSIYNASKEHSYSTITVRFSYYSGIGDEVGHTDKVIDQSIKAGETIHIDKLETAGIDQHADGVDMKILK